MDKSLFDKIFSPVDVGKNHFANRLVMAPMTRSRANPDGTPGASTALYYRQRASMGMMISEGVQINADGQGYMATPGIYNAAHVAGWKQVSDAVHEVGGKIFLQLWHCGRLSHPDNTSHHRQALAPSSLPSTAKMFTPTGLQEAPVAREMTAADIQQTLQDYQNAARLAIEAGADGVEIHSANGYLLQQFLAASANQRDDDYGGSWQKRTRFPIEVAEAVASAIGGDRVGIRLSPGFNLWGIDEGAERAEQYRHLLSALNQCDLAYAHLVHTGDDALMNNLRHTWKSTFIVCRPERARELIGCDLASGLADCEAYGRVVLANPDFVRRVRENAPFNTPDMNSFFGGTDAGYVDYPTLSD